MKCSWNLLSFQFSSVCFHRFVHALKSLTLTVLRGRPHLFCLGGETSGFTSTTLDIVKCTSSLATPPSLSGMKPLSCSSPESGINRFLAARAERWRLLVDGCTASWLTGDWGLTTMTGGNDAGSSAHSSLTSPFTTTTTMATTIATTTTAAAITTQLW